MVFSEKEALVIILSSHCEFDGRGSAQQQAGAQSVLSGAPCHYTSRRASQIRTLPKCRCRWSALRVVLVLRWPVSSGLYHWDSLYCLGGWSPRGWPSPIIRSVLLIFFSLTPIYLWWLSRTIHSLGIRDSWRGTWVKVHHTHEWVNPLILSVDLAVRRWHLVGGESLQWCLWPVDL